MAAPKGNRFWEARTKHGRDLIFSDLLEYDPADGHVRWRHLDRTAFASDMAWRCRRRFFGEVAGTVQRNGYVSISVNHKRYYAHRLAWLLMTGGWPPNDIDHKNGNRSDNRWENLRAATRSQNLQNRAASKTVGASWHARMGRWRAVIVVGGRQKHLGYFDTQDEAATAYRLAKSKLHSFQPTTRDMAA